MSIATMSAKAHALIPQDELIGSLTRERVQLAVRYAGAQAIEDFETARHWLAYALGTDVPFGTFDRLTEAFQQREWLEYCDLEFWHDTRNTENNRYALKVKADETVTYCVASLSNVLCSQLGVTA
jgi:hypothetical protein